MELRESNLPFSVADDAVEESSITSIVSEADYMENCEDNFENRNMHFEQHAASSTNILEENLRVNNIKASADTMGKVVTPASSATLLLDRSSMSAEEQRLANVNAIMHKLHDRMEKSKPSLYISLLESHTNSTNQSTHMQLRHEKVHTGCCGLKSNHKKDKLNRSKLRDDEIIDKQSKTNNSNKDDCLLANQLGESREQDEQHNEEQKEKAKSHAMASQTTSTTTSLLRSSKSKTDKQNNNYKTKIHISNNILTSTEKYYQPKQMKELHPLITDEPEEGNTSRQEHWVQVEPSSNFCLTRPLPKSTIQN